jgi:hypothetical protein
MSFLDMEANTRTEPISHVQIYIRYKNLNENI